VDPPNEGEKSCQCCLKAARDRESPCDRRHFRLGRTGVLVPEVDPLSRSEAIA
jgi:hypothetical protein